ncbi:MULTISPECIES: hypothetical protein [unclassified Pseudactinotalea]|uniref:hypothetical protein n=1 Tax=unclassified Pseudactinotalea TaxID=2649176 RepID=UPI00128DBF8B|nr:MULTISPECIES: hypothetical protein [unclassified Pseudactinotalea]MPV51324.1 hypothetical protein [Pseudactinotalea sp. HY160]QGH69973.1 hypothetical protein GCE65_10990 [Pseudactinotalea sp. HY158]
MLRFWRRHRAEPMAAELAQGFWASDAVGLQRAILSLLSAVDRRRGGLSGRVEFTAGAEGRVVVVWGNRIVGFVPPAHAGSLHAQLGEADPAALVADASIRRYEENWRVWVGPEWGGGGGEGGPEEPIDELDAPPPTILGIPTKRR